MNSVGTLIKEARLSLGWSKRTLAEHAGVSHSEVHRIENGERKNPSIPVLYSIADALNIPRGDILKASGYETSDDSQDSHKLVFSSLKTAKQQQTIERIVDCIARNGNLSDEDCDKLVDQVEMFIAYAKK